MATPNLLSSNAFPTRRWPTERWLPVALTAIAFGFLFASPVGTLVHEWLTDDDASYGLLLFPIALWLAWRGGILADAEPNPRAGIIIVASAVVLRVLGSIAAEFFTQRFSIWIAVIGLVVFCFGWRQVKHWWLPLAILLLSIPLPALLINRAAIPLQFRASAIGTTLIKWRHIPVRTQGNVIQLPNAFLFVAEACSGLRSLSALIALGVLLGGMYLQSGFTRIALLLFVVPVAVLLNGIRIFLTAFLVYFVDPSLGAGAAHEGQGMLMFGAALMVLAGLTFVIRFGEQRWIRMRSRAHA